MLSRLTNVVNLQNRIRVQSRQVGSSPVRFGWSQKEPPAQYSLTLGKDDFDRDHQPTPAFIEKISPFLMRGNNLQASGFLLVSDLDRHIPKGGINRFLEQTVVSLKQHLGNAYARTFNPQNIPLTIIKKRQVDGEISAEGNLHNSETQGKWTLKSPHFDRNALVVLHRYEPSENIKGGNLQVIDLQQFLHDHPHEAMEKLLNPDKTIRPEYWDRLEPYKVTLETNSTDHKVVFLHNTPQNGVAHGVTPLKRMDETKPIKRIFERYTITPFEPNKVLPADVTRINELA